MYFSEPRNLDGVPGTACHDAQLRCLTIGVKMCRSLRPTPAQDGANADTPNEHKHINARNSREPSPAEVDEVPPLLTDDSDSDAGESDSDSYDLPPLVSSSASDSDQDDYNEDDYDEDDSDEDDDSGVVNPSHWQNEPSPRSEISGGAELPHMHETKGVRMVDYLFSVQVQRARKLGLHYFRHQQSSRLAETVPPLVDLDECEHE